MLFDDMPSDGIAPSYDHQEGHRTDPKRFPDIVNGTIRWENKQQPTPGALSYAYETLALPEFGVVNAGIISSFLFSPVSSPLYQPYKSVAPTGYGGLVAGTIMSQPLYDPATNTYGGAVLE